MANVIFLLLFAALQKTVAYSLEECSRALGMESGRIKNEQLSASSNHDSESTGPQNARIRTETGSGAWCPRRQINPEIVEWLQIDFPSEVVVSGIETQGRHDGGRGLEYAPGYMLEYWRESLGSWARYKDSMLNEVLSGNSDTQSAVLRSLEGGIILRNLRIIPFSETTRTVCMRVELYGCFYKDALRYYTMPDGDAVDGLNLRDTSYDGYKNTSYILYNGIGKLYDGVTGEDNFEKHPEAWVGWRKDKHGNTITIEISLDDKNVVSAVLFHVSNFVKYRAQVFERAHVWFSPHGDGTYSPRTLHFSYTADKSFHTARWVRIPVPNRIAKNLRVELTMAKDAEWLLLSELKLESSRHLTSKSSDDRLETEEVEIEQELPDDGTLTYFSVNDAIEDNSRWISAAILIILITLFCAIVLLFYLLWICRRTLITKSAYKINKQYGKGVKMAIEGTKIKRTFPNAYRMSTDNTQNTLLEKLQTDMNSGSEYADPDCNSRFGSDSTAVIELSRSPTDSPVNHYASSDIVGLFPPINTTLIRNKTSSRRNHIKTKRIDGTNCAQINANCLLYRRSIGRSKFGKIQLCQLEKRLVIVKTLYPDGIGTFLRDEFESIVNELCYLRHQNILELIGVCTDNHGLCSCILEYAETNLCDYLRSQSHFRLEFLLSACTQVAAGMSYLESKNFVHGNLRSETCMITSDKTIKLTNFEMASALDQFNNTRDNGFSQKIAWTAWEQAIMHESTVKSDVWSFGVTLWEVLHVCRKEPFQTEFDSEILDNLTHMYHYGVLKLYLEKPDHCSKNFYEEFLLPCWVKSPEERPSFLNLHRRLQNITCSQMGNNI